MSSIPAKALCFGALSINNMPVRFNKTRIAQKPPLAYIMHSRAGCMPGQPEIFSPTYLSNPGLKAYLKENRVMNAYKRNSRSKQRADIVG